MRLPINPESLAARARFPRKFALNLLCLTAAVWSFPHGIAQDPPAPHQRLHDSDQWSQIAPHLPDPHTATPQMLEEQADILRARRFPEDAMDYYHYALDRGGSQAKLLNKLGLSELEMKNIQLARVYFKRVVKLDKKNAEAWNNLGAVEYVDGKKDSALSDYKHAIKLDKRQAVFHANLANAYFDAKDYRGARHEIASALELDPKVFEEHGAGGIAAHVLSAQDLARFSFEMAKMYAHSELIDQMLQALATAAEAGMDIRQEMEQDSVLVKFSADPRVLVIVHNALIVRSARAPEVSSSGSATTVPAKPLM